MSRVPSVAEISEDIRVGGISVEDVSVGDAMDVFTDGRHGRLTDVMDVFTDSMGTDAPRSK
ncbi:hypothetical protein VT50_0219830 [Streptomyces antioxidans]|uniref:Uncharacterized protein n=1 Tax=Streptomyces antioxidans TaxID=1507734 RepID=A0A1V4D2M8_9ACTN|nr:hypothetical protein [Streptomyces antioxidans]OPF78093.1 hypothetical protein VT50_0219830 [Streptomyces antioxidans]